MEDGREDVNLLHAKVRKKELKTNHISSFVFDSP